MMEVNTPPPEHISVVGGAAREEATPPPTREENPEETKAMRLNRCLVALEHPTVKVPYDIMNRKFRVMQKVMERDVNAVKVCVAEVQAALAGCPTAPPQHLSSLIKGVITQVNTLKRKARESVATETECTRVVRRRLDHLQEASEGTDAARANWENTRFDRLLTDYLLREGCYDTARKLAETRKIESLTNLEIFQTAYEVEKSLRRKEVSKCLAWCHENRSKLKRISSCLEFNLRRQEFIEMVKRDERMSAVWHARKFFSGQDGEQLASIQRCMALLAFPSDTSIPEYQALLSETRWQELILQFRAENLRLFQLCPQAAFTVALQAGLSALKTPQCCNENRDSFNPDCPTCVPNLNYLARGLPYAHCSQSSLVCHISGEVMDDSNLPLVLPNGYVYGANALERQAALNDGKVHCPRGNADFKMSETLKVFVL